MKELKRVSSFETTDGKLHRDRKTAMSHQARLNAVSYFEENKAYGSYEGCKIEGESLVEFIEEHADFILNFLKIISRG